jgi:hydroxyacylglutathione hydrolase
VENLPLGHLEERLGELPRDRPLVLHCQSGARSAIAASVLRSHGFDNVIDLQGGYAAWQAAGHPTEHGAGTPAFP